LLHTRDYKVMDFGVTVGAGQTILLDIRQLDDDMKHLILMRLKK